MPNFGRIENDFGEIGRIFRMTVGNEKINMYFCCVNFSDFV